MTTSQQLTVDFMAKINAGHVQPAQMVAVLQSMHAALVDRFEHVSIFMEPSLEQVADRLVDAMRCAETNEQDYPEAVEA